MTALFKRKIRPNDHVYVASKRPGDYYVPVHGVVTSVNQDNMSVCLDSGLVTDVSLNYRGICSTAQQCSRMCDHLNETSEA